ncbi:RNA-directed DNA polymerase, eukaryota, Reverse transcriptase zinc-binding domain protein [Artemisia annua]|uniref:RNA-directed DNA polymerase, eukaryota, Reverse transcriptase zinc-binding domain protein n=1 Tax=Artemisia annua TaxID=35608 RepID=A0A2U1NL82_ARTAN|nr:RNA-directed DNA polymerase, eukaryota, Reverse transcriptase zinc-binding domain protein [Artemisia annua]
MTVVEPKPNTTDALLAQLLNRLGISGMNGVSEIGVSGTHWVSQIGVSGTHGVTKQNIIQQTQQASIPQAGPTAYYTSPIGQLTNVSPPPGLGYEPILQPGPFQYTQPTAPTGYPIIGSAKQPSSIPIAAPTGSVGPTVAPGQETNLPHAFTTGALHTPATVHGAKLKGRSIWQVQKEYNDSWMWKTLLELRSKVRYNTFKVIGNGQKTNMWYDQWSSLGVIKDIVTIRSIHNARFSENMSVEMIANNEWRWPESISYAC